MLSLSCIGKGNGNPLQCSCLENPRDGGAWWAAVYGVAQSRTQLKRLSSSKESALQLSLVSSHLQSYSWGSQNTKPAAAFSRALWCHPYPWPPPLCLPPLPPLTPTCRGRDWIEIHLSFHVHKNISSFPSLQCL